MKNSFRIIACFILSIALFSCEEQELDVQESLQKDTEDSNVLMRKITGEESPQIARIPNRGTILLSNLNSPVGIEFSTRVGGLLIVEAGTGNQDGSLSLFRRGRKIPLITQFPSQLRPDGNAEGATHVLVDQNIIWIVNGVSGKLYRFNFSNFDGTPKLASEVPSQNVKDFLLQRGFTDSNIYNLTKDQNGNILIVDSGANVVIKRSRNGQLSIFSSIPPIGGAEAVPTGIVSVGNKLLVSAFGGFPFASGSSRVYTLDASGNVISFQDGYTSLIDLKYSSFIQNGTFALQLGQFGQFGFAPNSGSLVKVTPNGPVTVIDRLNFPNGLELIGRIVLITSLADGTLTSYFL